MDWHAAYERSWLQGRDALRNGGIRSERPPGSDDSGRWGVSVLLWPDSATTKRLMALADELVALVGPHRWAHDEDSLHFTVRALEPYRESISDTDERIRLYREAVEEAARGTGGPASRSPARGTGVAGEPVRLDLVGLTLARNGVLVCGVPVDDAAERLRGRLRNALSVRGISDLESEFRRDTWHATLLHYTGPPSDPDALIRWVEDRRRLDLGRAVLGPMALYRSGYDGRTVRVHSLATVELPLSGV